MNEDGFGNTNSFSAFSAASYRGNFYVGTWNNADGCGVYCYDGPGPGDWTQVNVDGFGAVSGRGAHSMAVFNDRLYVGVANNTLGCQVWEYDESAWSQVNANGFGDASVAWVSSMAVFGGRLYVGTSWTAQVWEYDGSTWSQVNVDGFGNVNNQAIRSMAVYDGSLYAGVYNTSNGAQVWRFDGGTSWTQLVSDGFGGNFIDARSMMAAGNSLFVGTAGWSTSCQVWEYDGSDWTRNDPGASMQWDAARCMEVYAGDLYVGTGNDSGTPEGSQVWRYDGTTWEQVNDNGFGDTANEAVHCLASHDSCLWAGVANSDGQGGRVFRNINPRISSTDPALGAPGQTNLDVTITGADTNFVDGVSVATFSGTGITVNSTSVNSLTEAVANIDIDAGAALGARDVNVVTGTETPLPLLGGFSVGYPPPSVTGIDPSLGYRGQTLDDVSVTGSDFRNVSTTVELKRGGETIAGTDVTWVSAGQITCDLVIPAGTTTGSDWDVFVQHNDDSKSGTLDDAFTVDQLTVDASVSGGGGAVDPSSQEVDWGGTAIIDLAPDPGYHLDTITDNGAPQAVADPYVISNVREDHDVVVTFAPDVIPTTTWYLAEGATAGGMEAWVLVQNPNPDPVQIDMAFDTGAGELIPPELQGVTIPAESRATFNLGLYATTFDISTRVTSSGGDVICERAMYGNDRRWGTDSIGTTAVSDTWYLAEGCTDGGTETFVLVQNPGDEPAEVYVDFMTGTETVEGPRDLVPAHTRRTYKANAWVEDYDVSTRVTSNRGIVCERAMYSGDGTWAHDSIGTTAPSATWYLAEGCTQGGMETFILIQNPGASPVIIDVDFMTSIGLLSGPQDFVLAAGSRVTFKANDYVTDFNVSTMVTSQGGGIICERAMYSGDGTWAHDSIGTTAPAATWYLAEGCTQGGMETFVLVQNPGDDPVSIDLFFMTSTGPVPGPQGFVLDAGKRVTFKANDYTSDYNVSTMVTSEGGGVICERAMYGTGRTWAHDSIGHAP
ncbi:MAG: hypothetical protein JW854_14490 [Actinobacteria bacterium]|nr:hypothetical protein [Actinomycetota bacterium]